MSLLTVFGVALGLAMDATAVAITTSTSLGHVTQRQIFRFAFHFGLFQTVMPVLGWITGHGFAEYIEAWDHWVAFGLLSLIGGKELVETLKRDHDVRQTRADPTRGWTLLALSIATSIDALAVGLSFGMLETPIVVPSVIIGVVTAALTTAGMVAGARLGTRLGARFGQWMRILGGLVLIFIGVKILVAHLSG